VFEICLLEDAHPATMMAANKALKLDAPFVADVKEHGEIARYLVATRPMR
jgi:hypothetical protein